MSRFHPVVEVESFDAEPVVNLPEHPLRSHFTNGTAAGETRRADIRAGEGLERVAEFVRDDAIRTAVDADGGRPEGANLVVNTAAEGRAAAAVADDEKEEFVFGGVRIGLVHKLHVIDVEVVEAVGFLEDGINVE